MMLELGLVVKKLVFKTSRQEVEIDVRAMLENVEGQQNMRDTVDRSLNCITSWNRRV
jgi:hypothetical protein